ncbi:phosphoenolpyruvate carboxylase [Isoalcanivorax indicus]|uniref:phosphoenolpyruvate carboxylase n=1 Tax=Isoalcanivorax indicus TaxID=2202653 RepID=UPI00248210A6|nr:phosphoenolpyruvate carboxylase [Isoalcanivorax indicus]
MTEADLHAPLRENVRLLGDMLGQTLREQQGEALFALVERIRQVAVEARSSGAVDMRRLSELLTPLDEQQLLDVARAFSQFLNLANLAEQQHRVRLRRRRQGYDADIGSTESLRQVIQRLLDSGLSAETVRTTLSTLSVELVLTAHPTEVSRRTLIRKYDQMAEWLAALDRTDLGEDERGRCREGLRRSILSAWCTDEIRRERPTPVDEAKWGFATLEQSLWQALPVFLRELDDAASELLGGPLPAAVAPIRIASWMGGDRDGNPNVTASVTREVLRLARWMAADLYIRDVEELLADFAMHEASDELLAHTGPSAEPYRIVLRGLRERLRHTRAHMESLVNGAEPPGGDIIRCREDLLAPLMLIDRSLRACNMAALADGALRDTVRRAHAFGVTLLRLDIRQESSRHSAVLDAVTRYLGLGCYLDWSEAERQRFLLAELDSRRPLIDARFYRSEECTDEVREVLDTCAVIASESAEALGAYVISMATSPSDILAVMLLQRMMGVSSPMRVVPLFETLSDLQGAGATLRALLAVDSYREAVGDGQEIMIGYSDSAKDAGFLAAAWAQYRAQEELTALFAEHGIALTLFHGRGGSISRGGSPTRTALLSQPPGSVAGRIRVTEQGEVIRFKYGMPQIAIHNMEQYVAATLEATLLPPVAPGEDWRAEMAALTGQAVAAYREVVRDTPALVDYLRTVTPEQELTRLALGSRPARRKRAGGLASLRAIPWVFAWTQIRLMLPAWLGTGVALNSALADPQRRQVLDAMQRDWPFFQGMLDMLEMVLAKADVAVASYYEERLTRDRTLRELGAELRERLQGTVSALQGVSGRRDLLANNPVMRWSVQVRNPYTDPLHLLQAELMGRLRDTHEPDPRLESALMVTITGIAAGLRNTG